MFVGGATIMAAFADGALPSSYLVRPLIACAFVAMTIGVLAQLAGRHGSVTAAFLAGAIAIPGWWVLLAVSVGALVWHVQRIRRRPVPASERPTLMLTAIFCLVSVAPAIPLLDIRAPAVRGASAGDPPIYLVLLDGYPRIDTLEHFGIDNRPFVQELENRGFDHYPQATSAHGWTELTLTSLLTNRDEPDEVGSIEAKRALRARLALPANFVAIAPPVGHVEIPGARRIDRSGMNDFEAYLLGRSLLAHASAGIVADGLRAEIAEGLFVLASTEETRVFAHILSPHPPFLYTEESESLPRCWPRCQVFDNAMESLDVTREQWSAGMQDTLEFLNVGLLDAVDDILDRHDDAVIVLFSDHGARYSYDDPEEWHRSFLIARTPGHPGLLADQPKADAILRIVIDAYE